MKGRLLNSDKQRRERLDIIDLQCGALEPRRARAEQSNRLGLEPFARRGNDLRPLGSPDSQAGADSLGSGLVSLDWREKWCILWLLGVD